MCDTSRDNVRQSADQLHSALYMYYTMHNEYNCRLLGLLVISTLVYSLIVLQISAIATFK